MGPAAPSIWFDETRSELAARRRASPDPLEHPRRARAGLPIRTAAMVRARVDDCVIAPAGRSPATLVHGRGSAEPELARSSQSLRLDLPLPHDAGGLAPAGRRSRISRRGSRSAAEPRESGSQVASSRRLGGRRTRSLALDAGARESDARLPARSQARGGSDVGASQGPFGSILKNVRLAQRTAVHPDRRRGASPRRGRRRSRCRIPKRRRERPPTRRPCPSTSRPAVADATTASGDDTSPMPPPDPDEFALHAADGHVGRRPARYAKHRMRRKPVAVTATAPATAGRIRPGPRRPRLRLHAPPMVPSPTRMSSAAPSSSWRCSAGSATGADRSGSAPEWTSSCRPSWSKGAGPIRFRSRPKPEVAGPGSVSAPRRWPAARSTEWIGLFGVRSGSLRLQGLDLVVTQPENLPADRLAAITVAPGAELILDRLHGHGLGAALDRARPWPCTGRRSARRPR